MSTLAIMVVGLSLFGMPTALSQLCRARGARIGVWSGDFDTPWDWRARP